jgi:hypothetical protein
MFLIPNLTGNQIILTMPVSLRIIHNQSSILFFQKIFKMITNKYPFKADSKVEI